MEKITIAENNTSSNLHKPFVSKMLPINDAQIRAYGLLQLIIKSEIAEPSPYNPENEIRKRNIANWKHEYYTLLATFCTQKKSQNKPLKQPVVKAIIKAVEYWTQKELKALPVRRKRNENIGEFDSLVILPTRQVHDSGYRCMDFVAVKDDKPFCRFSGYFDSLVILSKGWSVDCLKTSGLLQLFADGKMRARETSPSFEIYAEK